MNVIDIYCTQFVPYHNLTKLKAQTLDQQLANARLQPGLMTLLATFLQSGWWGTATGIHKIPKPGTFSQHARTAFENLSTTKYSVMNLDDLLPPQFDEKVSVIGEFVEAYTGRLMRIVEGAESKKQMVVAAQDVLNAEKWYPGSSWYWAHSTRFENRIILRHDGPDGFYSVGLVLGHLVDVAAVHSYLKPYDLKGMKLTHPPDTFKLGTRKDLDECCTPICRRNEISVSYKEFHTVIKRKIDGKRVLVKQENPKCFTSELPLPEMKARSRMIAAVKEILMYLPV